MYLLRINFLHLLFSEQERFQYNKTHICLQQHSLVVTSVGFYGYPLCLYSLYDSLVSSPLVSSQFDCTDIQIRFTSYLHFPRILLNKIAYYLAAISRVNLLLLYYITPLRTLFLFSIVIYLAPFSSNLPFKLRNFLCNYFIGIFTRHYFSVFGQTVFLFNSSATK